MLPKPPVLLLAALVSLLWGCWSVPTTLVKVGPSQPGTMIAGLSTCSPTHRGPLVIDPDAPLTLLVHGCNFSTGGFRTLAEVFEAHGQQTICFNYNDRDKVDDAAAQLAVALDALESILSVPQVTILGHSQGGLVARRALTIDRQKHRNNQGETDYRLVTVSSPFGGIRAATHCGYTWMHVLSLGTSVGICQLVTGSKWTEIFPGSDFIRDPGTLSGRVRSHLKIVTDERHTCRQRADDGTCAESDFVFDVEEQFNAAVDDDGRVAGETIAAGHIEIVGERGAVPAKLIRVLQEAEVLAQTPPERREQIAALIARLYQ